MSATIVCEADRWMPAARNFVNVDLSNRHEVMIDGARVLVRENKRRSDSWIFKSKPRNIFRNHRYFVPIVLPVAPLEGWPVKNLDLLDESQKMAFRELNEGLRLLNDEFLFGDVCDDLTLSVALNIGSGFRLRITAYYGSFDSYYLSFFKDDDIVRQECLDLESTIAVVTSVYEKFH